MAGELRQMGRGMSRRIGSAARLAAMALFPHFCLECSREGCLLCPECEIAVSARMTGVFRCPRCGRSAALGATCCGAASGWPLDGVISASFYGDPRLRQLLRDYKYAGVLEGGEILRRLFAAFLGRFEGAIGPLLSGARIMAIPLHYFRRCLRGFNQVEPLVSGLADTFGTPEVHDTVLERRPTSPQARKTDIRSRLRNASGLFEARQVGEAARYFLIDDVMTSGATLTAAAATLKEGGASEVWGLTLLRGRSGSSG